MDRHRERAMNWFDRVSFLGLLGIYFAIVVGSPIIGAILFFFPILPIYAGMGWEFSNLGPIATFAWGIMFDIFVATPSFIILLIVKLIRKKSPHE